MLPNIQTLLMRNPLVINLFVLVFAWLLSCTPNQTPESDTPADEFGTEASEYNGPIIDMHLHADNEESGMFGLTHPPTLRGETYDGVKSATEQKEMTLQKLDEHNIVKAMVDGGEMWHKDAP